MEISSNDMSKLHTVIEEWKLHPEIELEATFGSKGAVDMQTFLRVASRLKAKGFEAIQQEDRLTIAIPDQVRFTLNGFGVIQQYCRDNILSGKPFIAMIKDRATTGLSNIDISDYDARVKVRREIPLAKDDSQVKTILGSWESKKKYFRLIRRWSFHSPKSPGLIFDLSMVRSTAVDKRTREAWVDTFQRQAITTFSPSYELEVELSRSGFTPEHTNQDILKRFLSGIGDILRGIQGTPILIRKQTKERVMKEYTYVVETDRFRGVAPVTLELKNMTAVETPGVPNIRQSYNVTDKADGLRVHAFVDEKGELFMIDMAMNIYKTGLQKPELRLSLLDGEYVTKDKHGNGVQELLIFDIYYGPGKENVTKLPFNSATGGRYDHMKRWFAVWIGKGGPKKLIASASINVAKKSFFIADKSDIFEKAAIILNNKSAFPYNTDGLIFTPNHLPIPGRPGGGFLAQFKWKPAEDNSIDFLASTEKDVEYTTQDKIVIGIHPTTGQTLRYKILRLFVGSARDTAYENPRQTILFETPLPEGRYDPRDKRQGEYKPVLFNPTDFPDIMANTCYLETYLDPDTQEEYIRTALNEPIRDKSIIEMRYESQNPPGWRWVPMRIRTDKTERLQKGIIERSLNSEKTAESVWNSIHEPITESMIRTGSELPSEEEQRILASSVNPVEIQKKYWERKASAQDLQKVRGLRDFHNRYIKDELLYGTFFKTRRDRPLSILDIAVGRAGDIRRWQRGQAGFVFGIDYAGENITDPNDGAYKRYMNLLIESRDNKGALHVPDMFFAIGDGSKRLITGEAGITTEESDIMKSILGKIHPDGAIPSLVEKKGAGRLSTGTDGFVCMFALHYFFESIPKFKGFLQNIDDTLKVGGYFLGTAFDGQSVFNFLRTTEKGRSRSGVDNTTVIWEIKKEYEGDELPVDESGLGMPIDVEFISIGAPHREYLISWEFLVRSMKSIGCELIPPDELAILGLKHSTHMFESSYDMAYTSGKKYYMSDVIKQFSFLNRWFIFKRVRKGDDVATSIQEEGVRPLPGPGPGTEPGPDAGTGAGAGAEPGPEAGTGAGAVPGPGAESGPVLGTRPPGQKEKYSARQVFQFHIGSVPKDTLGIQDELAGRWLSPTAQFPILDPTNKDSVYPSMEHFMAGMKLTLASKKPSFGNSVFGTTGTIHQDYLRKINELKIKKQFTEITELELMKQEVKDIKSKLNALTKDKSVNIDETLWNSQKQNMIDEAIHQRLLRDVRFCRIVAAVVDQGLYPLYSTVSGAGNEFAAARRVDGTIDGDNKIGKAIITQAFKYPETIEECKKRV